MDDTLIERLEAASGPDRELDLEIWRLVDPMAAEVEAAGRRPLEWLHCYTSSLDMAVKLVPEGCWDHIEVHRPDFQTLGWTVHLLPNGNFRDRPSYQGFGQSWPLALCIAALRAQAGEKS